MCFLLISLSFMAATWLLKYQTILDCFYQPCEANARKSMLDNESATAIDMNNATEQK